MATVKMKLTARERKAGMDLRDVLGDRPIAHPTSDAMVTKLRKAAAAYAEALTKDGEEDDGNEVMDALVVLQTTAVLYNTTLSVSERRKLLR